MAAVVGGLVDPKATCSRRRQSLAVMRDSRARRLQILGRVLFGTVLCKPGSQGLDGRDADGYLDKVQRHATLSRRNGRQRKQSKHKAVMRWSSGQEPEN